MNYVKKMCILRQIKQGFSGDGKTLSGLVKIEQYGKNLAIEVSIINFAPLASGEYYCLLSDGHGKTEMLSLRGKSMFNILSDVDITGGFCAVICYVKNDVVPIAYGINGNGSYDWKTILNATLPPVFPKKNGGFPSESVPATKQAPVDFIAAAPQDFAKKEQESQKGAGHVATNHHSDLIPSTKNADTSYNDETIVTENYYQEQSNEQDGNPKNRENAHLENSKQKPAEVGRSSAEDGNAKSVLHPFKTDSDGYYLSIKNEIDELFHAYPKDETLSKAFSTSEWVRVKGTAKEPEYLVGVLYEDGRAKYICYALAAKDKDSPPEEIKDVCNFVPISALSQNVGFFVIFQSANSGQCIHPEDV